MKTTTVLSFLKKENWFYFIKQKGNISNDSNDDNALGKSNISGKERGSISSLFTKAWHCWKEAASFTLSSAKLMMCLQAKCKECLICSPKGKKKVVHGLWCINGFGFNSLVVLFPSLQYLEARTKKPTSVDNTVRWDAGPLCLFFVSPSHKEFEAV